MRCWSLKKPYLECKRCKNDAKWKYYPFCHAHQFHSIYYLISFCAALIFLVDLLGVFGLESPFKLSSKKVSYSNTTAIFEEHDSLNFNVLILRFEDYYTNEDTECIGRSIQDYLTVLSSSEDYELPIPINAVYVGDTIIPPTSPGGARIIKNRHNADLLLFGLAKMQPNNCASADLCFRYSVGEQTLADVPEFIDTDDEKYDKDFDFVSLASLESGLFSVNEEDFSSWMRSLIYAKNNDIDNSFAELDKLVNSPTESVENKILRIQEISFTYMSLGYYEKALDAINQAIYKDQSVGGDIKLKLFSLRALIYLNQNKIQPAVDDYNKCLDLNPLDTDALANMGSLLEAVNHPVEAIRYITKAIAVDSTKYHYYFTRAKAYHDLGDYDSAISDFDLALELNEKDPEIIYALGNSLFYNKQFDLALTAFKIVLSTNPLHVSALYKSGLIHIANEDYKLALNAINKALKIVPDDVSILGGRAALHSVMNHYRLSLRDYRQIIFLQPANALALLGEIQILVNLERYKEAIKKCQSLTKMENSTLDRVKLEELTRSARDGHRQAEKKRKTVVTYLWGFLAVLSSLIILYFVNKRHRIR